MNLKDKVVVITGSSKGFGKELAIALLREGANVVINSNNEKELEDTTKEIEAFGICADVTKEEEVTNLADKVIEKFGKIDIWVNNAGMWIPHDFVENFDMDKVRNMFDLNVFGVINGSRVALRNMKKQNSGTLMNIISDSALAERPMSSLYCASKWAVNGFTKSIREENKNISVLSVYPGGMKTSIFGSNKPDNFNDFMEVSYVVEKVIDNLKKDNSQDELVIQK